MEIKVLASDGFYLLSLQWSSKAQNLLMSEDVMAAINAVRKLGIKVS